MSYRRPLSIKIANLRRVQKISTVTLRTSRALRNQVIVIFMACRESGREGNLVRSSPPAGQCVTLVLNGLPTRHIADVRSWPRHALVDCKCPLLEVIADIEIALLNVRK